MKITPDTNVLIRAAVLDDPAQTEAARRTILGATLIAVTIPCLCEFVWVLARRYRQPAAIIAASVRSLLDDSRVQVDRPAATAGLRFLDAGADFADGVIAHQGAGLGGTRFVSFDRRAVAAARAGGMDAAAP